MENIDKIFQAVQQNKGNIQWKFNSHWTVNI